MERPGSDTALVCQNRTVDCSFAVVSFCHLIGQSMVVVREMTWLVACYRLNDWVTQEMET